MKWLAVILAIMLGGTALADDGAPIPAWYLEHVEFLTRDGGRWVADNSEYRNEQSNADFFVVEFHPSFEGSSMTGRLYARVDGQDTIDFWEFRSYWDPMAGLAILMQVGWDGALGIGITLMDSEGVFRTDQAFGAPGQTDRREGHVFTVIDADTHQTESFEIGADGGWTPQRTYRWFRES